MRPFLLALWWSSLAVALAAGAAWGQEMVQALEAASLIEERLLDSELERYAVTRLEEQRALQELEDATQQLDSALADRSVSLQELGELEGQVGEARAAAAARSEEAARLRQRLMLRLERMAALDDEITRRRRPGLVRRSGLDGTWRLEVIPLNLTGIVRLRSEGTLVTGTYLLENDSQGSLTGTYAAGRLLLERIDLREGFDATLRGELSSSTGLLQGSWTTVDVTGGRLSGGTWSARKLTEAEVRALER